jgi:hypothetical protein
MARATSSLLLQAMLALVVVTMGTPGEVDLDELAMLQEGSDPVELGEAKAVREFKQDAVERHPSYGHVAGRYEQVQSVIQKIGKQAKLAFDDDDTEKHWNDVESLSHAKRIAGEEMTPETIQKIIQAQQQRSKAKRQGLVDDSKAEADEDKDTVPQIYHQILTKLSKDKLDLPDDVRKTWTYTSASKLAGEEDSTQFKSKLRELAIQHLQQRAAALEKQAKVKKQALAQAEAKQAQEIQNKDELKSSARRVAVAQKLQDEELKAKGATAAKAQEAAKQYSQEWTKLKEADAKTREVEEKVNHCEKNLVTARNDANMAKEEYTMNQNKALKAKLEKAQAKVESIAEECEQLSADLSKVKTEAKGIKAETERKKVLKDNAAKTLKRVSKEAKQAAEASQNQNKGLQAVAKEATRTDTAIEVVSATMYCAMKKNEKTSAWEPHAADFKGTEDEIGNQSDQAKEECNGKNSCDLKIPKPQQGCPSSGYVARFKCPTEGEDLMLIELGEQPSNVAKALAKLARSLEAKKVDNSEVTTGEKMEVTAANLKAKIAAEASGDSSAVVEVSMLPGKPVEFLKLACPTPKMSKTLKKVLKKQEVATEKLASKKEAVQEDIEAAKEKAEDAVQDTKAAEQKAEKAAETEKLEAKKAQNEAADDKSKVENLKQKLQADKNGKSDDVKVAVDKAKLKSAEAKAEVAKKLAEVAEQKAVESKKAAANAKDKAEKAAAEGSTTKQVSSSKGVQRAVEKEKEAQDNVDNKEEAVEEAKKVLEGASPNQIPELSAKVAEKIQAVDVAKKAAKNAEEKIKEEQEKAGEKNEQLEDKSVAEARDGIQKANLQAAILEAKKATATGNTKVQLEVEAEAEKKKAEAEEKIVENAAAKKQAVEEANNEELKKIAEERLKKNEAALVAKKAEDKQVKEMLKNAKSPGEILQLTSKVSTLDKDVEEAKERVTNAAEAVSKVGTRESAAQKKEARLEKKSVKLEKEITSAKEKLGGTDHPEKIAQLADKVKELVKKSEETKVEEAKAKAKVEKEIEEEVTSTPKQAKVESKEEPSAVKKDPVVVEAKKEESVAKAQEKAASAQAREVTEQKMKEAGQQIKEVVKQDKEALQEINSKVAKQVEQIQELKGQVQKQKANAKELAQYKKDIIEGRNPDQTSEAKASSTVRSKAQVSEAVESLSTIFPGSSKCDAGKTCCLVSFADEKCESEGEKMCTVGGESNQKNWQQMISTSLPISGKDVDVSLQVQWAKDESKALDEEQGSVLRVRACGAFIGGTSQCFPRRGAGYRFTDYFNAPFGECIVAGDVVIVSKGKLRKDLTSTVQGLKSQQSAQDDTASQKEDAKSDSANNQKQNLDKAFGGQGHLAELVTELLEIGDGEFLTQTAWLGSTSSFQLTMSAA